jgi:hypothetical protein
VDATADPPLETDPEDPPFTIEKQAESEPVVEPEPETDSKPETEAEPEPETQPEPVLGPVTEPEPERDANPETEAEPATEAVPSEEPEPEPEPDAGQEPEPVTEWEPETKPEPEPFRPAAVTEITGREMPEPEPDLSYTYVQDERRSIWPWVAGIAILAMILIVVAWFVFPDQVSKVLNRETVVEGQLPVEELPAEQPPPEETIEEETVSEEISPPLPPGEEPAGQAQETRQYYVVAGCFENIENAESHVKTLRSMGYDSRIFGMRDNLHAVCFNSHTRRAEALAEMYRIRQEYEPAAWILYY